APELEALASEVCDMWQDYFSALAGQSGAKADLAQLLEPQRRLFADFLTMMQHRAHGAPNRNSQTFTGAATTHAGAGAAAAASDNGALRVAQLAHRLAELEKRVGRLEAVRAPAARKSARPRGK